MAGISQINDEAERVKIQKELDRRWYTGEGIFKELACWNVLKDEFLCKMFLSVPPPTPMAQQLFADIGIPLPTKIISLD